MTDYDLLFSAGICMAAMTAMLVVLAREVLGTRREMRELQKTYQELRGDVSTSISTANSIKDIVYRYLAELKQLSKPEDNEDDQD